MHPDFDQIVIDILRRDPAGIAIFIDGNPNWSAILRRRWQRIGAEASSRIKFVPRMDPPSFQSLLARADVVLDTIYFSGGITSAEALSLGTPIVTYGGCPTMAGRVTYAYYRQIGVAECVAETLPDYVDIAVRLGTDRTWRDGVSAKIKDRQHLLFERSEVIDELDQFFRSALAQVSG